MTPPLDDRFTGILDAMKGDALLRGTLSFAQSIGFTSASAMTVTDCPLGGKPTFVFVNSAPPEALASDTPENGQRDPVMQHCKRSSLPLLWDRTTYLRAGEVDLWESCAAFGFSTGMAVATHSEMGRHFFIGIERDQPLPRHSVEMSRLLADFMLFAAFAEQAACRVLLPADIDGLSLQSLSQREIECLRWTMEGKTAWEIGQILSISEQKLLPDT